MKTWILLLVLLVTSLPAFANCNGTLPLDAWNLNELHWGYRCPFTPSTGYNIYRAVKEHFQLVDNVPNGDILQWTDPIYTPTSAQRRYMVVAVNNSQETYGSQITAVGQLRPELLNITSQTPYQAGTSMTVVADMLNTALPLEVDRLRLYALHGTIPIVDVYVQNCSTTPPPSSPTSAMKTCSFVLPPLAPATRYEWRMESNATVIALTPLFSWIP